MKRRQSERARLRSLAVFVFVLVLLFASLSPSLSPREGYAVDKTSAVFPASLQFVYAEAFSGTAFESVIFQDEFLYMGGQAFENAGLLRHVYLPRSTRLIEDGAFPQGVFVHGVENSYVQTWAEKNGYPFVADDIWNERAVRERVSVEKLLILLYFVLPLGSPDVIYRYRRVKAYTRSMRPQDRAELYPINYRFP